MLAGVSDLLASIRRDLDERLAVLKPAAEEFAQLQRAAAALETAVAPSATPRGVTARPATRRRAGPRRGSAGRVSGRAAPGETQLRVIEQLRAAPGSSSTAVAEALGISANAAAATISRLVKQGRVSRLQTGGYAALPTEPPTTAADAPQPL